MTDTKTFEPQTQLSDVEQRLGRRIHDLRSARDFTLDALAKATGFTKGYLSKIENSKVIPPIGTLVKLAEVLKIELGDLLGSESSAERNDGICIVRSWEREPVLRGGSSFGYDYTSLAQKKRHKHMDPFIMVFPSNIEKDVRFEHDGEEFLFILDGEIEFGFVVEGKERLWVLSPGDSVYFDSRIPHRGRSLKGESRALVVIYRTPEHPAASEAKPMPRVKAG
ncbi:MAG TPA: helix-turn-helix domain-containing protein [Noviherbaspirillum sp.]|jgi:transcriptional regulator with XRE-family HTH domain|uniref:helix-turn-helix domain-containing protein n=1 Tax=Noviherbaspirillum sp. TaxID=1926288 RepID=UPI002DDD1ACA|nr:helix-turn-helix domain-containing protein [Noviherbaspirillum sp.]HEV2610105.1 helix-turn-helix domain-containing protein [Noviherbaspirillum sp.]